MNRILFSFTLCLCASLIYLVSCKTELTDPKDLQGSLTFNFVPLVGSEGGRIKDGSIAQIWVSVESIDGAATLERHAIDVWAFGESYISDPIPLSPGSYQLTEFFVVNSSNEIIYATPQEGSLLSGLVEFPLPITFAIEADKVEEVILEVISTLEHDPEDFGYVSLNFSVVPITNILVSVLKQSPDGAYKFIESDVLIIGNNKFEYEISLGDSVNTVPFRGDFTHVHMEFRALGTLQTIEFGFDSIQLFISTPLTIIFTDNSSNSLNEGLVAYYPFNGNAEDASPNLLHGLVEGALLTTDRHGLENSAYSFSSTSGDDVIVVKHNDVLNISDNLTLSAWIKLNSTNLHGSRIIDKIVSGTGIGFMMDVYNPNNTNRSPSEYLSTVRFVGNEGFKNITSTEVDYTTWTHVVTTYQSGNVKIYIDGVLASNTQETKTQLQVNNEDLQIGNVIYGSGTKLYSPFDGSLDEIRVYNRVLTEEEIVTLSSM